MTTITIISEDIQAARQSRQHRIDTISRYMAEGKPAGLVDSADWPLYSSERDCPIAQALRRTFAADRELVRAHPSYSGITVATTDYASPTGASYTLDVDAMPGSAVAAYMAQWDKRWKAAPRTFRLHNRVA